ncbi:MAG: quercetin 2,3-dioxygenase, partial [Paraburkholderia sp.]|nr:quercetin 2,3-dioxygenase [Paraburkholderia sp.]
DARVYAGRFDGAESAKMEIGAQRYAYVHVARGSVKVNGVELGEGDGARIRSERELTFTDGHDAEVLVFDLRNIEVSELWS